MKKKFINFNLKGKTYSKCLLEFLYINNMYMLPNYPFKKSLDEEICEAIENKIKIKELEEYCFYCLTHLEEVIKINEEN